MKEPSQLYLRAKQFVDAIADQSGATAKGERNQVIATHFGVKPAAVEAWFRSKSFPQHVFEAWTESMETGKVPEPVVEPTNGKVYVEREPEPEFEPESHAQPPELPDDPTEARFLDLHQRTSAMEGKMDEIIALLTRSAAPDNMKLPPPPGNRSSRQTNAMSAAGIINPGLPGIGSGRAPTREEAHNAEGGRNKPAGPAKPRVLRPGQPGTFGWNKFREKPQIVQLWPSPR